MSASLAAKTDLLSIDNKAETFILVLESTCPPSQERDKIVQTVQAEVHRLKELRLREDVSSLEGQSFEARKTRS